MAFQIYTTDDGRTPGLEYLPCGAMVPKTGTLLKAAGGMLTPAGGTEKPLYFCMANREEACQPGELIPVFRLGEDMILEAELPQGFAGKLGDQVQLTSGGTGIAAGAGGWAQVTAAGEERVWVRISQTPAAKTTE